jgi:glycosyltransferase involved in cell wall biosynthesis
MIAFTGQMDYRPNVEAVIWFVEAALPKIRARFPDVRFAIVGRNPTDEVKALAHAPDVIVTGEVADVRGWIAAASVVVAPLRQAHGVQNKVLEAMAMARPVVATGGAAQGIDHGDTIRIGDSGGEFADHVINLLADPDGAEDLGAASRRRVIDVYGWNAQLAPLDMLMDLRAPAAPQRSAA